MAFKKGLSGNPAGRPRGAVNRTTKQVREVIEGLIDMELDNIPELFLKLDPKGRLDFFIKLLPYVTPKLNATFLESQDYDITIRWLEHGDTVENTEIDP